MGVETEPCFCGSVADRLAVNRMVVIGTATVPRDERNYRQSYGEYREAVAEVADHYQRVNGERAPGEQVRGPNYYNIARAQARATGAKVM